jgi:hypothetical protein
MSKDDREMVKEVINNHEQIRIKPLSPRPSFKEGFSCLNHGCLRIF